MCISISKRSAKIRITEERKTKREVLRLSGQRLIFFSFFFRLFNALFRTRLRVTRLCDSRNEGIFTQFKFSNESLEIKCNSFFDSSWYKKKVCNFFSLPYFFFFFFEDNFSTSIITSVKDWYKSRSERIDFFFLLPSELWKKKKFQRA